MNEVGGCVLYFDHTGEDFLALVTAVFQQAEGPPLLNLAFVGPASDAYGQVLERAPLVAYGGGEGDPVSCWQELIEEDDDDDEEERPAEGWVEVLASLNGGRICATCSHCYCGDDVLDCECRIDPPKVIGDGEGGYVSGHADVEHDRHCSRYDAMDLRGMREVGLQLQELEIGGTDGDEDEPSPDGCCGEHGCKIVLRVRDKGEEGEAK